MDSLHFLGDSQCSWQRKNSLAAVLSERPWTDPEVHANQISGGVVRNANAQATNCDPMKLWPIAVSLMLAHDRLFCEATLRIGWKLIWLHISEHCDGPAFAANVSEKNAIPRTRVAFRRAEIWRERSL